MHPRTALAGYAERSSRLVELEDLDLVPARHLDGRPACDPSEVRLDGGDLNECLLSPLRDELSGTRTGFESGGHHTERTSIVKTHLALAHPPRSRSRAPCGRRSSSRARVIGARRTAPAQRRRRAIRVPSLSPAEQVTLSVAERKAVMPMSRRRGRDQVAQQGDRGS